MLKRVSTAFLTALLLCVSGTYTTTFAQTSAPQQAALRPSLSVCPILTLTKKFNPNNIDCVTPLDEVEKLEEKQILHPHKKPEGVSTSAISYTPYFTSSPSASFTPSSTGQNNPDTIFNLINEYRGRLGLPPFEKDANLCSIAASRGPEMPGEIAAGTLHSGLYNRNLPYWITENMKYGGNEVDTVNWWLNSPIHHAAIVSNAKYACGTCVGDVCDMLFTSYVPKAGQATNSSQDSSRTSNSKS